MTDKVERRAFIEALKEAMEAEVHGQHFYRMAAATTKDEQGRKVFEQLAEDEGKHYAYLSEAYATLRDDGELKVKVGEPTPLSETDPIFSRALVGRIGTAHFEMSALSVGCQLELNSMNFYRRQAEAAGDESLKSFFRELLRWEQVHYDGLMRQYESLKEGYWAEAGFAPF